MASQRARAGLGWRQLTALATATLTLSVGAGIASAQTGGVVAAPIAPAVDDVACAKQCVGTRQAREGSIVRVSGRRLGGTTRVTFRRAGGGRLGVAPRNTSGRRVRATVPAAATTGRVGIRDAAGATLAPGRLRIVNGSDPSDGDGFRLTHAQAAPAKAYFFARPARRARIHYTFAGGGTTDVRIQVFSVNRKRVVRNLVQRNRQPGTPYTARWNGRTGAGKVAPNGRYRFRIAERGQNRASTTPDARFRHYGHIFPIRSKQRSWGDGIGAGRGHQGQDVFSPCGARMVAARGGIVRHNRYQSAAGYYLVIKEQGTRRDHVYMHLRERSRLKPGDRVRTGQFIGRVGETGNASGCHLHFELWSGPGWYRGGRPLPAVTKHLRRWSRWS